MTENEILDDMLNETKSIALEIINKLIGYGFRNQSKFFIEINAIYSNYMILTISYFCKKDDYLDQLVNNKFVNNLVCNILDNMIISADCNKYSGFLATMKAKIYIEVIIPLLWSTEKEHENFKTHPQEFSSLLIDTCEE